MAEMNSTAYEVSTDFLDCEGRKLFAIGLHPREQEPRGSILFLHPFAEEINKSRRTVAQQARALAVAGYHVMLLDLSGCGDSSGYLADASWANWKEETAFAIYRLIGSHGLPVTLWGLRLGALLACDVAQELSAIHRLLMWQPALNGEQHIDQFLRFELAGQALKGESGFDRVGFWNKLRSGCALHVAGYELSSQLAIDISRVRLGDLKPACPVLWMDVAGQPATEPSVANRNVISRWQEQGVHVEWRCVEGQSFWRNVDAADSPHLLSATVDLLSRS